MARKWARGPISTSYLAATYKKPRRRKRMLGCYDAYRSKVCRHYDLVSCRGHSPAYLAILALWPFCRLHRDRFWSHYARRVGPRPHRGTLRRHLPLAVPRRRSEGVPASGVQCSCLLHRGRAFLSGSGPGESHLLAGPRWERGTHRLAVLTLRSKCMQTARKPSDHFVMGPARDVRPWRNIHDRFVCYLDRTVFLFFFDCNPHERLIGASPRNR